MKACLRVLPLVLAVFAIAEEYLTNDSILRMVKSGLSDDLIASIVHNQPGRYSLTPDDIAKLRQAGVSERITTAMAGKLIIASPGLKIEPKTPVRLSVDEPVSSKFAKAGDTFKLVVAEDVAINGHVVIAKGAAASGRIITAEKRVFTGGNGKLEVSVDSVRAVDGRNIPIDGRVSVGGGESGFGRTGKNVQIERGQIINAVVSAETTVAIPEPPQ